MERGMQTSLCEVWSRSVLGAGVERREGGEKERGRECDRRGRGGTEEDEKDRERERQTAGGCSCDGVGVHINERQKEQQKNMERE